jgi:acetoin utilization protein AcuC
MTTRGGEGRHCPFSLVWEPGFLEYDFGPHHPFTERSRAFAVSLLDASGFFPKGPREEVLPSVPVPRAVLQGFHTPGYLDRLEEISWDPRGRALDQGDTPAFPGCFEASTRIVGGTLAGLRAIQQGRCVHAVNPAGGLHHAHPSGASGFCILNDLAVTIRQALDGPDAYSHVAYVDLDAHHGDGVMYGFYEDGRVLDIDFHQDGRTLFPGTGFPAEAGRGDGAGLKVNLPLPPGAGDEAVNSLFERVVPPLLREFHPDLIVLQTGVDAHAGDPLAHLQYTLPGYRHVVERVHALAHELAGGRLLQTGGGGYLAENVARVLAATASDLAGRPVLRSVGQALPTSWREDFQREFHYPSPRRWDETVPLSRSPWDRESEEDLVQRLEASLGVRLPVPSGASDHR